MQNIVRRSRFNADDGIADVDQGFFAKHMKYFGIAALAGVVAAMVSYYIVVKMYSKTMLMSKNKQYMIIAVIAVVVAVGAFFLSKQMM